MWHTDMNAAPRGKTIPDDIRKTAAKTVFDLESRIQAGEFNEPQSTKFSQTLVATFENVILEERERSALSRGKLSIDKDEFKKLVEEGRAFADTNPEARFIEDSKNACPYCGESGHKDDVSNESSVGRTNDDEFYNPFWERR